jgi:hypothetical protein
VVVFNNGNGRQCFELSKQLQALRRDVTLFSRTQLELHEGFFIQNYQFYPTGHFPGRKGGTAVAGKKCVPHNHTNLPNLVSIEATRVCIPTGNSQTFLAALFPRPS